MCPSWMVLTCKYCKTDTSYQYPKQIYCSLSSSIPPHVTLLVTGGDVNTL